MRILPPLPGRFGLVATLLLALAGCADPGQQACKVETAADLRLLPIDRRVAVEASLAGQPVILYIDTGTFISSVTQGAADRFDLRPGPDTHYMPLNGIGGTTFASVVRVPKLGLGHGIASAQDLPVIDMPLKASSGIPVLGLFGTDFLQNYDVDLDVPGGHFGLYQPVGCGDDVKPFDPPLFELPFRFEGSEIVVTVRLNGVSVDAILNSGATRTTIGRLDAARAGVTDADLAADQAVGVSGIDRTVMKARLHQFHSLEVGDERLDNFRFVVAGLESGKTILGFDFLRHNRVFISYARRRLFIQPASGDAVIRADPGTPPARAP